VFHSKARDALNRIQSLGHDIGLHFSTHEYWSDNPGLEILEDQVCEERTILQHDVKRDIEVVSFHIPPNWVLREQFERFTSTYEKRFFTDIPYRGDSNQRWRDSPPFADGYPDRMQVLVHPGLWGKGDASFERRIQSAQTERAAYLADFNQRQFIDDELSDWHVNP
jgi:peptidoglycan/xylan/chitin deacetylase (PgdA/CDA1 family)